MASGVNPSLNLKPRTQGSPRLDDGVSSQASRGRINPAFHYLLFHSDFQWKGRCSTWGGTTTKLQTPSPSYSETMSNQLSKNPRPLRSDSETWKIRYPDCTIEFERWPATSAQPCDPHRPRSPSQISTRVQDLLLASASWLKENPAAEKS